MSTLKETVPDKGTWTIEGIGARISLQSNDFNHDVGIVISGDFGSMAAKERYAAHIVDILNRGCARKHAEEVLVDQGGLLETLAQVARTPGIASELLHKAADEIARLRIELAEASKYIEQSNAAEFRKRQIAQAAEPSAFGLALSAALKRTD